MVEKGSQKIIDELGVAHATEVAGYAFYKAAAAMVQDKKGKNVFDHLASEELDHIKVLKAITDSLMSGAGWLSYEDAKKKAQTPAPIFPKENKLIDRLKVNQTDLNAVNIGLESEERAVEYYSGLLKIARQPAEKTILTKILEMEKGHLKILRWESEALVRTGFWGDTMEFSVEKETE